MNPTWHAAFNGRTVFVTGHTGFKGSWLALWLRRLGARVIGYALPPPTEPSNFIVSHVAETLDGQHEADIRDTARLQAAVRSAAPDVVFHLAAQSLVRAGYERPLETFETNVGGTAGVLEAVRMAGRPCVVVVVTSDKCYEHRGPTEGYRETDPLGGHDPYSASKAAAEHVVAAYRRAFFPVERLAEHGIKVASVRAGNCIGGGDWAADRIVTDIVRNLGAGQPVPVRNPRAVRPWQHVLEPLSGYLELAARMVESDEPHWCDAWNFGPLPGDDVPVQQLVDQFIAEWGGGSWTDVPASGTCPEAAVLRLCVDKAVQQLGWRPRWDLSTAVRRTAAWYRRYYRGHERDLRAVCEADIAEYEAASPITASSGGSP